MGIAMIESEVESEVMEVAKEAFEVFSDYNKAEERLNVLKGKLREYAAGAKKSIVVKGVGEITISSPSKGSSKLVLKINEDVLSKSGELKKKLMEKGVISEEKKVVSPSVASVKIIPNV
jgi:hypothetical protein